MVIGLVAANTVTVVIDANTAFIGKETNYYKYSLILLHQNKI